MAFEDYNIQQFMDAWFKEDRSIMSQEVFDEVFTEYIDIAKLYEDDDFEKVAYIYYLNGRINTVSLFLRLQRMYITNFQVPFFPGFEVVKTHGYYVKWNNNVRQFTDILNNIELKEKKFVSQLEKEIKELSDLREKKGQNNDVKQSRTSFVRTLNSLGKCGFKIDKQQTTVEELAYMIKQQTEENEMLKSRNT